MAALWGRGCRQTGMWEWPGGEPRTGTLFTSSYTCCVCNGELQLIDRGDECFTYITTSACCTCRYFHEYLIFILLPLCWHYYFILLCQCLHDLFTWLYQTTLSKCFHIHPNDDGMGLSILYQILFIFSSMDPSVLDQNYIQETQRRGSHQEYYCCNCNQREIL